MRTLHTHVGLCLTLSGTSKVLVYNFTVTNTNSDFTLAKHLLDSKCFNFYTDVIFSSSDTHKDASKMASLLHVNMSTCIIICTNDYEFLLNSQTVSH